MLEDNDAFVDEDEGEAFDFDSGDDIPEADHPPPQDPALSCMENSQESVEASHALPNPDLPEPSTESNTAPSLADDGATATSRPSAAGGETAVEVASAAEGSYDREEVLPPPPPVNSDSKHTGL